MLFFIGAPDFTIKENLKTMLWKQENQTISLKDTCIVKVSVVEAGEGGAEVEVVDAASEVAIVVRSLEVNCVAQPEVDYL